MHQIDTYQDAPHRQQVIALWTDVFGRSTGHNDPALSIDKKVAVDDGLFFVALVDDQVVGTTLGGYDGHRGWLYSVAVARAFRSSGIGAALVRRAEQALAQRGCAKINLQIVGSNAGVADFYQSLGYEVEDRISMGRKVAENIPATD